MKWFAPLTIVVSTAIIFLTVVLARKLYSSFGLNAILLTLAAVSFCAGAVACYLIVVGKLTRS